MKITTDTSIDVEENDMHRYLLKGLREDRGDLPDNDVTVKWTGKGTARVSFSYETRPVSSETRPQPSTKTSA